MDDQLPRVRVYRYLFWDEHAQHTSFNYATLEAIANNLLGIPVYAESRHVPAAEIINGVWRPRVHSKT